MIAYSRRAPAARCARTEQRPRNLRIVAAGWGSLEMSTISRAFTPWPSTTPPRDFDRRSFWPSPGHLAGQAHDVLAPQTSVDGPFEITLVDRSSLPIARGTAWPESSADSSGSMHSFFRNSNRTCCWKPRSSLEMLARSAPPVSQPGLDLLDDRCSTTLLISGRGTKV